MGKIILFFLKPLSFLPALAVMYMIFTFSGQTGEASSNISYKTSSIIVTVGEKLSGKELSEGRKEYWIDRIHGPVRKMAHMSVYFVLAICISFPLYVYGLRGLPLLFVAGIICVGFACTDEYHQSFVEGRGPSKRDVLIDGIGSFLGIMAVRIVCWTLLTPVRIHERIQRKKARRKKRKGV